MIFDDSFLPFVSRQFPVCALLVGDRHLRVCVNCRYRCVSTSAFRRRAVVVSTSAFGSRRRLLAVTLDVRRILSSVGVGHSEESFPLESFGLHRAQVRCGL